MFSIPTIALRVSVPIGAVWNTWLLGCSLCNKTGNSQSQLSLVLHTEFYGGRGVGDYYNFKILKNFLVISVWIYWDDLWLARFFLLVFRHFSFKLSRFPWDMVQILKYFDLFYLANFNFQTSRAVWPLALHRITHMFQSSKLKTVEIKDFVIIVITLL